MGDDKNDLDSIDTYTLSVTDLSPQKIALPSEMTFRYFKIKIPSKADINKEGATGVEPSLAEVYVEK